MRIPWILAVIRDRMRAHARPPSAISVGMRDTACSALSRIMIAPESMIRSLT